MKIGIPTETRRGETRVAATPETDTTSIFSVTEASPALREPLSNPESDILTLIVRCLSNKYIGRTVSIGPETVKWHLKNLFGKLNVNNCQLAAIRARALSLIQ